MGTGADECSDMQVRIFDKEYITIEYYENGSKTPTKVKTLYVEE